MCNTISFALPGPNTRVLGKPARLEVLGLDLLHHLKSLTQEGVDGGKNGVEEATSDGPVVSTPTHVRITVDAFRGDGSEGVSYDELDDVTEDFTPQPPAMVMDHGARGRIYNEATT